MCSDPETKKSFETYANEISRLIKYLDRSDIAQDIRDRADAIKAIFREMQKKRKHIDTTDLMVEINRIINENVEIEEPEEGLVESRQFDISRIDFDLLALRLFLDLPGAKINQGDERGMSPLMYAIRANNAEAVKLLLDRGANVNTRSRDGFSAAEMGRNKPDLAHFFPAPKKSQTRYTAPRRTVSRSSSTAKSTPNKTSSRRRRK